LDAGDDVNFVTQSGSTVLDEEMDIPMLDLLLKNGLNTKGKRGLLLFFTRTGQPVTAKSLSFLKPLLDRGLDPKTSLFLHEVASIKPFYLSEMGLANIESAVILLMKHGADPLMTNAHVTFIFFTQTV
jgi:hypothetical protein